MITVTHSSDIQIRPDGNRYQATYRGQHTSVRSTEPEAALAVGRKLYADKLIKVSPQVRCTESRQRTGLWIATARYKL